MSPRLAALIAIVGAGLGMLAIVALTTTGLNRPLPTAETVAKVQIGGPFTLIDHTGRQVTDSDFKGKFMLIFFGYTYCPDICPTTLTEISDAVNMLGDQQEDVVPVFVTVDPERDTTEHLGEYVTFFHPRLVGLTGSLEQIADVARAYKIYFRKGEIPDDDPGGYLVDHSSIAYLIGRDGDFVTHFSHGTTPEDMARRIRDHL